ncbi:hypothetical protein RSOLAG22IIIB_09706 [Rhizoctonia solani]|uniref:Uncharacterized protein n=1 Tax=Rhizoctonia solani TaxID=456999 RepID=A0A0K6G039_9AGAM|nr:hypothetical protein RSOLAG22IIIB_09706 [Rhizoctonia solani]
MLRALSLKCLIPGSAEPSSMAAQSQPEETTNQTAWELVGSPEGINNPQPVKEFESQDNNNRSESPDAIDQSEYNSAEEDMPAPNVMVGWTSAGFRASIMSHFDIHAAVALLAKDVLELREDVDEIYRSLCRLDEPGSSLKKRGRFRFWFRNNTNTSSVAASVTQWGEISKEYDRLLLDSRRLATTVANAVEDFRTDIFPLLQDNTVPVAQKMKKLDKFIATTKEVDQSAEYTSKELSRMPGRMNSFHISYESPSPTRPRSLSASDQTNLDEKMHVLNTQIRDLVNEIRRYNDKHDQEWNQLRESIPKKDNDRVGELIITAIGELLGPTGCESVLVGARAAAAVTRTQAKITRARLDLSKKKMALKELENKVDGPGLHQAIQGRVKITESRTQDICKRLEAIAKIWAVASIRTSFSISSYLIYRPKVRADTHVLHEIWKRAVEKEGNPANTESESAAKGDVPKGCHGGLCATSSERHTITQLYENLENVLISYANAVA